VFQADRDLLALDFDGVIADSIQECLVIGHNAYNIHLGTGDKIEDLSEMDKSKETEARRLRRFIRSGEDYVYINHALAQKVQIENQDQFDAFKNKNIALREHFENIFYDERIRFFTENEEKWIRLNPLYPGMKDFLQTYPYKENLFVVTTKRTDFVTKILRAHRIELLPENLFQATSGKKDVLLHLMRKNQKTAQNMYFIDDQVDTLIKVADTGIHIYLAKWGYNNQQQIERAEQEGIPILTLEEFYKKFFPSQ